jgi:hypothetical protein
MKVPVGRVATVVLLALFPVSSATAHVDEAASFVGGEGDEIALPAGFDTQNAKAVLGIVKCDPIDQPSQDLGRGACSWCFGHHGMMRDQGPGMPSRSSQRR